MIQILPRDVVISLNIPKHLACGVAAGLNPEIVKVSWTNVENDV